MYDAKKVKAGERNARIFMALFGVLGTVAMFYTFAHASSVPMIAG